MVEPKGFSGQKAEAAAPVGGGQRPVCAPAGTQSPITASALPPQARRFPLDRRFAVEFSLDGGRLEARWSPHIPRGRKARNLRPAYRVARADFLAGLGLSAVVIEA